MLSKEAYTIYNQLKVHIPHPVCELEYKSLFQLVIMSILSAQTTDKKVNKICKDLFEVYPNATSLQNASVDELYLYVKSLGFGERRAKMIIQTSKIISDKGIICDETYILSLPGVGRKVMSIIMCEGFKKDYLPIDTHIIRISSRLDFSKSKNPLLIEKDLKLLFKKEDYYKLHLTLIHFGRYMCLAKKPKCLNCYIKDYCKYNKEERNI